jgi:hypothetical protein
MIPDKLAQLCRSIRLCLRSDARLCSNVVKQRALVLAEAVFTASARGTRDGSCPIPCRDYSVPVKGRGLRRIAQATTWNKRNRDPLPRIQPDRDQASLRQRPDPGRCVINRAENAWIGEGATAA